jgi:Saxitoxin biosynthesis operon protein SxtJ
MQVQPDVRQLRAFGLLIGSIFLAIGLWPTIIHQESFHQWPVLMALLLIVPAVIWPWILRPLYTFWMRLADLLGWINTRIILGIVFYTLFTPMGIIRRRLLGKDALHRVFEPQAETYRVIRHRRSRSHLEHQF